MASVASSSSTKSKRSRQAEDRLSAPPTARDEEGETDVQSIADDAASLSEAPTVSHAAGSANIAKDLEKAGSDNSLQGLSKKDVYRKYLIKSGFKYAIVRALVALYEDKNKPDDPLQWILGFVGFGIPTPQDLQAHKDQIKEMREKLMKLQEENVNLKRQVELRDGARRLSPAKEDLKRMIDELTEKGILTPCILTSIEDPLAPVPPAPEIIIGQVDDQEESEHYGN